MSTFVHMELNTSDPEAAKQFYKAVFGWQYQDTPMPDGVYTMVSGPDGGIGGIARNPMPDAPSSWLGYIAVDSVERAASKVEKAGGRVVVPATDIPNMGRFAVFTDPQGASFAVWEAAAPGSAEQASEAPSKKKTSKKKAAAKQKSAAAAEPTEQREQPSVGKKTSKKTAKKASKKAPTQEVEEAPEPEEAPQAAPKKTSKKAAKKAAKEAPAAKKAPAKKAAKKAPAAEAPAKKTAKKAPAKKAPAKKAAKKAGKKK